MTFPNYEAAARLRADREGIDFYLCPPEEQVDRLWAARSDVEAALGVARLYRFEPRDGPIIRHTTHHDSCQCYELVQVWPSP